MKRWTGLLLAAALLSACAGARDPHLLKYETYATEIDQKTARGEISQMEADNLKLQAHQEYQAERRREERELLQDSVSQQIKSQNQEINAVLRQSS